MEEEIVSEWNENKNIIKNLLFILLYYANKRNKTAANRYRSVCQYVDSVLI